VNRPAIPATVHELAARLGVKAEGNTVAVKLTQTGRIKRKIDTESWLSFTAIQSISVNECAFDWRARAGPFGMVSAHDALKNGVGQFDITALGFIPIVRAAHSSALMRGELIRYLAELAWSPDAIVRNGELCWRQNQAGTIFVSAGSEETSVEVELTLDREGRIAGAYSPNRPRSATAPFLPTPWRGHFSDFHKHRGMWIPYVGEVGWEIDGKYHPYWQGRIEQWEVIS
jgi:hypothetical protein